MPLLNRSINNESPQDYRLRNEFYCIASACGSDVSMRSVSRSLPASENLNIGRAQGTDDLNEIEQQNEG